MHRHGTVTYLIENISMEITMNCNHVNTDYGSHSQQVPGMAYVPWQRWKETYAPCNALQRGTLFPVLDKPFKGGACK